MTDLEGGVVIFTQSKKSGGSIVRKLKYSKWTDSV